MEDYVFDWERILFGSMPLLFYVEILIRTVVLYTYSLGALRLLGRRSAGELTPLDLVVVISLGSAMGDPMFYPQIPVLHGMAVITLVIGLQGGIVNLINRKEDIEQVLKGQPLRVVEDGVINRKRLAKTNLSREELFMTLRQNGYKSLGQIEHLYLETDGKPSIYPFDPDSVKYGLPLTPPWDVESPTTYTSGESVPTSGHYSMLYTGETRHLEAGSTFPARQEQRSTEWTTARKVA